MNRQANPGRKYERECKSNEVLGFLRLGGVFLVHDRFHFSVCGRVIFVTTIHNAVHNFIFH